MVVGMIHYLLSVSDSWLLQEVRGRTYAFLLESWASLSQENIIIPLLIFRLARPSRVRFVEMGIKLLVA